MRVKLFVVVTLMMLGPAWGLAGEKQRLPNIVHILVDDVGYDDLGCYGAKDIKTPNVDRLAAEGIRFTSYYAPSATCTPTRAAILTGKYPIRVKDCTRVLFPSDKVGIENQEITIATLLRRLGYATGLIGKWHLGHLASHLPTNHGFDRYLGIPYPNDHSPLRLGGIGSRGYPPIPLIRDLKTIEQPADLETLPERFVKEAIDFMTENKSRPFYLHLANIETHTPWFVSKRFQGKSQASRYGDAVECMDWMVGEIMRTLKDLGLDDNTLVVFSSDNGPLVVRYDELEKCYGEYARVDVSRVHRLRGGKYQARYEGGIRVACIARWPGKIPPGKTSNEIVAGFDLFHSFASAAGAEVPKDRVLDGKDILPLMRSEPGAKSPHAAFFGINDKTIQSVRQGNWKLVLPLLKEKRAQLYDLERDLGEKTDRADQHADIVERLTTLAVEARTCFETDRPLPGEKTK